jgi:hypothetical protein
MIKALGLIPSTTQKERRDQTEYDIEYRAKFAWVLKSKA